MYCFSKSFECNLKDERTKNKNTEEEEEEDGYHSLRDKFVSHPLDHLSR